MIRLFLELGFQDEASELTSEIADRVDDLVEALKETSPEDGETAKPPGGC